MIPHLKSGKGCSPNNIHADPDEEIPDSAARARTPHMGADAEHMAIFDLGNIVPSAAPSFAINSGVMSAFISPSILPIRKRLSVARLAWSRLDEITVFSYMRLL